MAPGLLKLETPLSNPEEIRFYFLASDFLAGVKSNLE